MCQKSTKIFFSRKKQAASATCELLAVVPSGHIFSPAAHLCCMHAMHFSSARSLAGAFNVRDVLLSNDIIRQCIHALSLYVARAIRHNYHFLFTGTEIKY